ADVAYLVDAMLADLVTPASNALADLDAVRRSILATRGARMFMVGSSEMEKSLSPRLNALSSRLTKSEVRVPAGASPAGSRHIEARLFARDPTAKSPVHVGLLAPNMRNGVITTSIPGAHFSDAGDREKQLDYLASRLYGGAGAHGIFLKTLAAGLAYSNGLRGAVSGGRLGYYAERTPEIPQTVRFVIEELKKAPHDPKLTDYAIAQVFSEFRSASSYESRAEGIAADLADNQPPAMVRKFRESILELRKDPALGEKLFDRMDRVYGRMLPGYNVKAAEVSDGIFFVIGPDKQLDAWSEYLKGAEGPGTRLFKLYPRDYWMP
ncbi:MAG: hypothetical protein JJE51_06370, partial [Thermoanaerobaculia bacterium]|nr:hypothetical protein [Thermoanaerobaculia bacterium]